MTKPTGDEKDSHHMPADSKSHLDRNVGPAIQMDPADHALTNSYKGKMNGPTYAAQRQLLANRQVTAAMSLDILDVKGIAAAVGQPGKYDSAITQMTAYASCLKAHGIIQ